VPEVVDRAVALGYSEQRQSRGVDPQEREQPTVAPPPDVIRQRPALWKRVPQVGERALESLPWKESDCGLLGQGWVYMSALSE
jgi:hypothetical protein